jgi:hypothetical protein
LKVEYHYPADLSPARTRPSIFEEYEPKPCQRPPGQRQRSLNPQRATGGLSTAIDSGWSRPEHGTNPHQVPHYSTRKSARTPSAAQEIDPMMTFRILAAAVVVSVAVSTPALARSHHHKYHHHHKHHYHHKYHQHHSSETDIYLHNYGPAVTPDQPFAYYDGPASVRCKQSAASYRGQDGRRHPCN